MYYMYINRKSVHQVGDKKLYYDAARSTNHQECLYIVLQYVFKTGCKPEVELT